MFLRTSPRTWFARLPRVVSLDVVWELGGALADHVRTGHRKEALGGNEALTLMP